MLVVLVYCHVKAEAVGAFKAACIENARHSILEEGVFRFDVIQQQDELTRFVLVEIYRTSDAPAKHKETAHYAQWRDTVAEMFVEPRYSVKYSNVFPTDWT